MGKCTGQDNLTPKQHRGGNKCHAPHPKRPRSEKLQSQEDWASIRPAGFCTKATMILTILLLLLVFADCAYHPSDAVGNTPESEDKLVLPSSRVLQDQRQDRWADQAERDVTPTPVATPRSTLQPIIETTIKSSSDSPAPNPVLAPATLPDESLASSPSDAPSAKFSDFPSSIPSFSPSRSPVVAPSQEPTNLPSGTPSEEAKSLEPSIFPTDGFTLGLESKAEKQNEVSMVPIVSPISFKARLEGVREDDIDDLLPRVATIWRAFFKDTLEQRFGKVSFVSVQLVVTADDQRRRLRMLQRDNVVEVLDIYARGQINMQFDNEEADTKKQELLSFLDGKITGENLQNALTSSNTNFEVSVEGEDEDETASDDRPKLWEIILGFSILAVAVGTIIFWAVIFWRKRQKRIRKRKLASVRNATMSVQSSGRAPTGMKSSAFLDHSTPSTPVKILPLSEGPRQSTPALFPKSKIFLGRALTEKDNDDDDSDYKGQGSDDSDAGSEFGRQLREAASLDKASWEEFQRQKRALEVAARSGISSGGEHDGLSDRINVSMYDAGEGDGHEGIEVEHGGMHPMFFPYGDEKQNMANNGITRPKQVNSSHSSSGLKNTSKSSTNGADRYGTQDHGDFEPYGDSKDISLVGFSSRNPQRFGRQEFSDHGSSDEPSSSSLRASPTGSSWSGGDLTDMDEPVGTLSMLKEVEELSRYVQHYEQKRESRKMRELELKQREFDNKQRINLSISMDSQEREERNYRNYSAKSQSQQNPQFDTAGNRWAHRTETNKQENPAAKDGVEDSGNSRLNAYRFPQRSVLPASFESFHSSTDLSEGEDEGSHYLGIRPNYPLKSDNNSNIHHRRDHTAAGGDKPSDAENLRQSIPGKTDSASQYHRDRDLPPSVNPPGAATPDSKPSTRTRISVSREETRLQTSGSQEKAASNRVENPRLGQQFPSPPRNVRGKIGNIVNMFESKPHTAVVPPSPSVSAFMLLT